MSPSVRLFAYDHLPSLWSGCLQPWLSAHTGLPRPGQPPAVVVSPDVTRLGWLKRSWLESGGGALFGLQFWTPGRLRRHLFEALEEGGTLATREDLSLAMRLALGREAADSPLGVVAQDPSGFLAAWDAWVAAGAGSSVLAEPWRTLPRRLRIQLERVGLTSVQAADARLAAGTPPPDAVLGPVLIDGFSALQADFFPLLRAALRWAPSAWITVPLPRGRRLEQVWVGSLEAVGRAEAALVPSLAETGAFAAWAQRAEAGEMAEAMPPGVRFRLHSSREGEARALVLRIRQLLGEDPGARIGVAMPSEPLLTRLVAAELVEAGLPVHDSFGYYPPAGSSERLFAAWVAFQRTGLLVDADRLLEEALGAGQVEASTAGQIRRAWRDARERVLSEELDIITALLEGEAARRPAAREAVHWAGGWPRLPATAPVAGFLEQCVQAFVRWGGEGELALERERSWSRTWERHPDAIDREAFLEWLWTSLRRPGKARHPAARDTLAPIQLVSYEMVRSAPWTHLLLAGLNERLVPAAPRESAFLVPDAARRHLREAVVEGPQGAGHEVLREGAGFLLDEADRRALFSGALFDAIAETGRAVEVSATYAPEGRDRTATVLSDYYQRLFRAACGPDASLPRPEPPPVPAASSRPRLLAPAALPVAATGAAYARRFDGATPFDEYSFGFAEPPADPLELGAREWEAVLSRPATIWLQGVAGVRPREDFSAPVSLSLVRGSGVHRLLRPPGREPWRQVARGEDAWTGWVEHQASSWRESVLRAYDGTDREPSPLWREQWGRVRALAQQLARLMTAGTELPWVAHEYTLPAASRWDHPAAGALHLRGRVDALLVDDPEAPGRALVVDFKTGGDRGLSVRRLAQGEGLQLLLYAGALAGAWRCPVGLCLLKPGDTGVSVPFEVGPGEDPSGVLPGLVALGQRGVFGFAGAVRSAYAFVGEYPMAFIAPPAEIVMEKWRRTHPLLETPKGTLP